RLPPANSKHGPRLVDIDVALVGPHRPRRRTGPVEPVARRAERKHGPGLPGFTRPSRDDRSLPASPDGPSGFAGLPERQPRNRFADANRVSHTIRKPIRRNNRRQNGSRRHFAGDDVDATTDRRRAVSLPPRPKRSDKGDAWRDAAAEYSAAYRSAFHH